jgi:glycosyltransferase involved in cell wall biosynthesis
LRACDVVLYPHLGQFDLALTARWFRRHHVPVVWDALISLYDTVVLDRQLVGARSLWAWFLRGIDRLASGLADCILVDTDQNRGYWRDRLAIPDDKLRVVHVGAEDLFGGHPGTDQHGPGAERRTVLFYGKYIPLHGVEVIVRAAHILEQAAAPGRPARVMWKLLGRGQQRPMAEDLARELDVHNLRFVDWVDYEDVPAQIRKASMGLGIFGLTDKAQRVVPNKAYQILAGGRPLITASTPASRELLVRDGLEGAYLVPAGDPEALAGAVDELAQSPEKARALAAAGHDLYRRFYTSREIGRRLIQVLENLTESHTGGSV